MPSSDPYSVVDVSSPQPSRRTQDSEVKLLIDFSILKHKSTGIKLDVDASLISIVWFKVNIDDKRSLYREGSLDLDVDDISDSLSSPIDPLAATNRREFGSSRGFHNSRALQNILYFSGKDWIGSAVVDTIIVVFSKEGVLSPEWIVGIALVFERVDKFVC